MRTIQLEREDWGACFWTTASQQDDFVLVGNPQSILSMNGWVFFFENHEMLAHQTDRSNF